MTVARRGTPLRECAEIIKNDAHRVFTALIIRGFVPHARKFCVGGKKQDMYSSLCDRGRSDFHSFCGVNQSGWRVLLAI
ncbi:hypothetical protein EFER_2698 [Escherichia fergusonii ATCC 35469]|uniref:Uncharacterized protein n=1 Tax=Escherichia fergusonii (strain ATCC 35469 / DSM 13698 / CCUG 18766 / IAM 14443 / JCM 21226 / LMG 7866 / NBRC 102419 / NCTC 12128 / CDC 0568-73) TaxID=585054 RepID=B7LNC0_ESCF3|nr:hypothetical protein EFER_2698 [Escherichia fergusonii ATCC 35469]